ncbi:MAG: hypothetical protein EOO73_28485 [Myxococcales bacterium]|nr:MAG: hypothetical protein EOO73_28485 [Myxococcales bacterium]
MSRLRFAWALLLVVACEQRKSEVLSVASASEPSPNASVLPAPLAAAPPKPAAKTDPHPLPDPSDAGAPEPPRALRDDDVMPPETELRPAPGLSLEARLRWLEPAPPRSPEANNEALGRARDKTAFEARIDASSLGRLRFVLASRAFPFPVGTELRAREDRYGHALVWPGAGAYTPLPPGTLRAVLSEARVDASPLSEPSVLLGGAGNLLGVATQKLRLETSLGKLELEQAALPVAGSSGALFCRLLLELLSIAPESAACRPEHVPLRAEYTWPSGARFEVEVTKLTRRPELATESLATPPAAATLRRGELPSVPFVVLVEERELADLHARALPPPSKPDPNAPKLGLVFQNRGDVPRYLLVDGVPVVWLRADAEWLVAGLKQGRYNVQTRDFFGAEASPLRLLELPARYQVGD